MSVTPEEVQGGDIETVKKFRADSEHDDVLGIDGQVWDALARVLAVATVPVTVVAAMHWCAAHGEKPPMSQAEMVEVDNWLQAYDALRGAQEVPNG